MIDKFFTHRYIITYKKENVKTESDIFPELFALFEENRREYGEGKANGDGHEYL